MKNNNKMVFGQIVNDRKFCTKGFGFAECWEEKSGVSFSVFLHLARSRRVAADENGEPVFSDEEPRREPRQGDKVAVLLQNDKPEDGKAWPAQYWGYQQDWDAIQNAPWYRIVVNSRRFNGKFEQIAPGTVITAEGKMEFLQSMSPRRSDGDEKDRFGTVYKSGPVREYQLWERFDGDKKVWKACADPRPLPHGATRAKPTDWSQETGTKTETGGNDAASQPDEVKLVEVVAKEIEALAPPKPPNGHSVATMDDEAAVQVDLELEALAVAAGGRRRGTATNRPR